MLKKFISLLIGHIISNPGIYSVVAFFLISGLVAGGVYGGSFSNTEYLADFFSGLDGYSSEGYLADGVLYSLLVSIIFFVSGVSPFGAVVIPVAMGYKGFVTGYTVSAFVSVYGFKAIVFILVGVLPSALFWIPSYLYGGVNGLSVSCCFVRILRRKPVGEIQSEVLKLGIAAVITFFGILLSKFTEIFIIPKMLNIVGGLYV